MKRGVRMPSIVLLTLSLALALGGVRAAAPAAPPPAALLPINVAVPAYNMALSPVFLADVHGNYQRHGLVATIVRLNGSTVTTAALQGGDIQFEVTGAAPFLLSVAKGLPFVAIAAINAGFTSQLVVSARYLATHPVPAGASLAQRVAALQGATMGVISSTDIATARYLLQYGGLPVSAVRSVKVQDQVAGVAALQRGEVDALIISPPQSFAAQAQGVGRILLNTRDVPGLGTLPYDVAATTRPYAQAHPEVVRGFLAALEEALAEVASGTPRVVSYEKIHYPTVAPAVVMQTLDFVRPTLTPYRPMEASQWQGLEKFLEFSGELQAPYTAEEGRDWTNAFMPPRP